MSARRTKLPARFPARPETPPATLIRRLNRLEVLLGSWVERRPKIALVLIERMIARLEDAGVEVMACRSSSTIAALTDV